MSMKRNEGDEFIGRWKDAETMKNKSTERANVVQLFNDKDHNTYTVEKKTNRPLNKKHRENIKKLYGE